MRRYLTVVLLAPIHRGVFIRQSSSRNVSSSVNGIVSATSSEAIRNLHHHPVTSSSFSSSHTSTTHSYTFQTIQVHIAHRHGDRTPITPLKDYDYWYNTLPSSDILNRISHGTVIQRHDKEEHEEDEMKTKVHENEQPITTHDASTQPTTAHTASGIGPYGKLTLLGILQMIQVGTRLRDELFHIPNSDDDNRIQDNNNYIHSVDTHGNIFLYKGRLFHPTINPFDIQKVRVISTDFPRTIQSVQALLVGLLSTDSTTTTTTAPWLKQQEMGGENVHQQEHSPWRQEQFKDLLGKFHPSNNIVIDVRHTQHLIPDPQPRTSTKQVELEKILTQRSHILQKEQEMSNMAYQLTQELQSLLDESYAFQMSFGIGEEKTKKVDHDDRKKQVLAWTQIAEVITCLKIRDKLPWTITQDHHDMAVQYVAWKWFENLRHPQLAKLAMGNFVSRILHSLVQATTKRRHGNRSIETSSSTSSPTEEDILSSIKNTSSSIEPSLCIYSCHDSSLIGLLCAFRLEQPVKWPEYGSYFKIELLEGRKCDGYNDLTLSQDRQDDDSLEIKYFVRFSLNGQVLKTSWGVEETTTSIEEEEEKKDTKSHSTWNRMISLDDLVSSIQKYYRQEEDDEGQESNINV